MGRGQNKLDACESLDIGKLGENILWYALLGTRQRKGTVWPQFSHVTLAAALPPTLE